MYDAIIIGGGPAGLSAALLLGRCARRVLVLDSGRPRNAASRGLHGFLTRDGTPPFALRKMGREELARYPTVEVLDAEVTDATYCDNRFELGTASGGAFVGRLLLLATGRVDRVPEIPGFAEFLGRGVYHCPYCDGWEHHGQPIAVYSEDRESAQNMAAVLATWTEDVVLCPPGSIESLQGGDGGLLAGIRFRDGSVKPCRALFFCSDCNQRSSLPERLGCEFDDSGSVRCHGYASTNVPDLYVAGNVRGGIHLAIVAAAEGAAAGIVLNDRLLELPERHSPQSQKTDGGGTD